MKKASESQKKVKKELNQTTESKKTSQKVNNVKQESDEDAGLEKDINHQPLQQ